MKNYSTKKVPVIKGKSLAEQVKDLQVEVAALKVAAK